MFFKRIRNNYPNREIKINKKNDIFIFTILMAAILHKLWKSKKYAKIDGSAEN